MKLQKEQTKERSNEQELLEGYKKEEEEELGLESHVVFPFFLSCL